jgi:hypothetical protein
VQSESRGKVYGYGAFAYSAFSAYDGDFVLNLFHSVSEKVLLFAHSRSECVSLFRAF